jgi:hypothetical protein
LLGRLVAVIMSEYRAGALVMSDGGWRRRAWARRAGVDCHRPARMWVGDRPPAADQMLR